LNARALMLLNLWLFDLLLACCFSLPPVFPLSLPRLPPRVADSLSMEEEEDATSWMSSCLSVCSYMVFLSVLK
jgi:hypothetical protein